MRVHFVTMGTADTASTRVRALALGAALRRLGDDVSFGRPRSAATARLLGRGAPADVIVLQKVIPSRRVTSLLRGKCRLLVVDLDDALHLGYPGEDAGATRRRVDRLAILGGQADLLTSPSDLIASDLRKLFPCSFVHPGPAPSPGLTPGELLAIKAEPAVMWLGSPSTAVELASLSPWADLIASFTGGSVAVGAPASVPTAGLCPTRWSPDIERFFLSRATTGLVPLSRSPWNDRKGAYKALEYAAWGVRPIASRSPAVEALGRAMEVCQVVAGDEAWGPALAMASNRPADLEEIEALTSAARSVDATSYAMAWKRVINDLR